MYLNIVLIMLKTLTTIYLVTVLLRESAFKVLVPVTYASALGVLGALLNLITMAPYVVEGRLVSFYSNSSPLKRSQPPPRTLHSAAVAQLWLCDPVDRSPPGSSAHGDSPGKNTGVGCLALLQGIFPTQGSNPGLPNYRWILYQRSYQGSLPSTIWSLIFVLVSLVAQMVKNLPAMRETWVRSLGGEDPLEKGMATYSNILAWRIPWTEEPGGLQTMGSQRVRHDWATNTYLHTISQANT